MYLNMEAVGPVSTINRRFFLSPKELLLVLVLLYIHMGLGICGSCANSRVLEMDQLIDSLDYKSWGSCGNSFESFDVSVQHFLSDDISSKCGLGSSSVISNLATICANSELFCFPSTLPGYVGKSNAIKTTPLEGFGGRDDDGSLKNSLFCDTSDGNSSSSREPEIFALSDGKTISCSFNSLGQFNIELSMQGDKADDGRCSLCERSSLKQHIQFSKLDETLEVVKPNFPGFSSPTVEISPASLDWGQKHLYVPSSASITVTNTCNESVLHVYRPYSSNSQFYPCSFDEISLRPGEVASICFIFVPRELGNLSAHFVFQTSLGGFLVNAKGSAVESLYGIQPLVGDDIYWHGIWKKNLSLHNPLDDVLHVKEVVVWMSVAFVNTADYSTTICKIDSFKDSAKHSSHINGMDWLCFNGDQVDLPVMALRLHGSWEIDPHGSKTIIEANFISGVIGRILGVCCLKLESSSQDRNEIVLVPIEVEIPDHAIYGGTAGLISVFLEPIFLSEGHKKLAMLLFLRNNAPYLLKVLRIIEVTDSKRIFHIKYVDGLLIFPVTVTQIALISYKSDDSEEPFSNMFNVNLSCKLLILTNDSGNPHIEIPCWDVFQSFSKHQPDLNAVLGVQHVMKKPSGNAMKMSLGSVIKLPSSLSSQVKGHELGVANVDELFLTNWKSQGTSNLMSVIDDEEVLFPLVQIGSSFSKWITVRNPSEQPVVMQLILNSGAVVDECRTSDKSLQQSLTRLLIQNGSAGPVRYGFSLPETAVTEAYVNPHQNALFGPLVFHPPSCCNWSSSVLIRNNLSGVEWLPLRGSGGSLSMVLLEGSELVRSLQFNFNLPTSLNISYPAMLFHDEERNAFCSKLLLKELYALNTGDLPLEVRKIIVSGTDCGLDGFMIHNCKAFYLKPGESRRLLISYQTDFSDVEIDKELEFTFSTGKFVIPMKATLPVYMLNLCKKLFFWTLLKRLSVVVLIASVTLVVFCCILTQVMMTFDSWVFWFKTEKATFSGAREPSWVPSNHENSKFSFCNKVKGIDEAEGQDEILNSRRADYSTEVVNDWMTDPHVKVMQDIQEKDATVTIPKNGTPSLRYYSKVMPMVHDTDPYPDNLSIKVVKEKGKKRRKKRFLGFGGSTGIVGPLEVSGSQSGNSTPSSPLSPATSLITKQSWPASFEEGVSVAIPELVEDKNQDVKLAGLDHFKEGVSVAIPEQKVEHKTSAKNECTNFFSIQSQSPLSKTASKPVLLPSATFPAASQCLPGVLISSPFSASNSATPHARAPGSNLRKGKAVKAAEQVGSLDEFTYDIWGNHFSSFDFTGKIMRSSPVKHNTLEEESQSFFVNGPQILMQKTESKPVSPGPVSPQCAVTSSHRNG
ncbi:hypothetical protein Scep_002128 [Stephania cephalantha]|uniref:Transmembrane protein n=1 Tax=Stephania cephalantha TaxID=152367 RepID=A0AAP0LAV0_9MAGN